MNKQSEALRASLNKKNSLAYFMEAHSALSAKIVQKYNFDGIWASGLGIASAYGARDANEISLTEVIDVIERMIGMTDKPILADVDSGFGDFNNVRLLTRKMSRYGVAGICIEDKLFPKRNSFLGSLHELAEIGEFCGKIKAAKDSQNDDGFLVVARTETFISGGTMEQALERAHMYVEAGADAILVHSKLNTGQQVLAFGKEWNRSEPLIAVPTTYPTICKEALHAGGFRGVIWANHALRASIRAIDLICARISEFKTIQGLDDSLTSIPELFTLLDYSELEMAEERYKFFKPEIKSIQN